MNRRKYLLFAVLVCKSVSGGALTTHSSVATETVTDVGSQNVIVLHLNHDALLGSGLSVAIPEQALTMPSAGIYGYDQYAFRVDPSGLAVGPGRGATAGLARGSFLALGGLLFTAGAAQKPIDMRHFSVRPDPTDQTHWEIFDEHGSTWLILDHAHPDWNEAAVRLSVSHANLRLAKAFANTIGRAELTGTSIGGADFIVSLQKSTLPQELAPEALPEACRAPWPSVDSPANIRLSVGTSVSQTGAADTIAFERCLVRDTTGRLGPCMTGLPYGRAVFAPDASLVNIGSSAIPWYGMFTGVFPPYRNDQHPFLFWNLYRIDADGTLRQLGRSGVKHAFFAVNGKCSCPAGHVVYPKCEDVYSSFSNDSLEFIGPRAEVLPAVGMWGRCGSVFDKNCDGHTGPREAGEDDGLTWRLAVDEGELIPALHPGADYFFEYGYLVRDSKQPDGATGYRKIHPTRSSAPNNQILWHLDPDDLSQGTVLNHWASSTNSHFDTMNKAFRTADGSGAVAVRVIPLGRHRYRYLYAVMNFDLVHAELVGDASNLRVVDPRGIDEIKISHGRHANLVQVRSFDADGNTTDRWSSNFSAGETTWKTESGSGLTWGSVYSISMESGQSPVLGTIRLHVGGTGSAQYIEIQSLVAGHPDEGA